MKKNHYFELQDSGEDFEYEGKQMSRPDAILMMEKLEESGGSCIWLEPTGSLVITHPKPEHFQVLKGLPFAGDHAAALAAFGAAESFGPEFKSAQRLEATHVIYLHSDKLPRLMVYEPGEALVSHFSQC